MKQKWKGSYACYVVLFFFYYYCMSAFSSVLSIYLAGIGIGIADLSWIVSASSIFGFVIIPVIAYLCDQTGKPRQIAGILMVGIGVSAVLFAVIRRVWILFLLNGLTMSCISSVMPVLERMAGAAKYRYGILRIWGTISYYRISFLGLFRREYDLSSPFACRSGRGSGRNRDGYLFQYPD